MQPGLLRARHTAASLLLVIASISANLHQTFVMELTAFHRSPQRLMKVATWVGVVIPCTLDCLNCFALSEPLYMRQDARRDARSALSRSALVSDLGAKGVLNLVPEEIKQVQSWVRARCRDRVSSMEVRCGGHLSHIQVLSHLMKPLLCCDVLALKEVCDRIS